MQRADIRNLDSTVDNPYQVIIHDHYRGWWTSRWLDTHGADLPQSFSGHVYGEGPANVAGKMPSPDGR
jgi:hypothetical protein